MATSRQGKNLVILGMHRSGTSMVAGALASRGLWAGDEGELMPAGADNPKGFWERQDVVALNDEALAAAGYSWFQPRIVCGGGADEIKAVLDRLDRRAPWLLKDPRMIVTWPMWQEALEHTAKLFVYRSPLAVAASLVKRHGFPLDYGLDLWEFYNREALKIMAAEGGAFVSYHDFQETPQSTWLEVARRLSEIGVHIETDNLGDKYNADLDHFQPSKWDTSRLTKEQGLLAKFCMQACKLGEIAGELPPSSPNLLARIQEFGKAFSGLAEAAALSRNITSVTEERDQARTIVSKTEKLHKDLAKRYEELVNAHSKDVDEIKFLRKEREGSRLLEVEKRYEELANAHAKDVDELEFLRKERDGGGLLQEFGETFSGLAKTAALGKNMAAVTEERDQARVIVSEVEKRYEDLASARSKDLDELEFLRKEKERSRLFEEQIDRNQEEIEALKDTFSEITRESNTAIQQPITAEKKLAASLEREGQLEAKSEHLFLSLNQVYLDLLTFRRSFLGGVVTAITALYKLVSLRPHHSTIFEDILSDAEAHVRQYKTASFMSGRSRLGMAFSVLSYLVRHPASTARSVSGPRWQRGLSIFFKSSREDLEIWIQQRFPEIDEFVIPEVQPELEPSLDSLELVFNQPENPRVSIVMPVYNEYRMTIYCLQSLLSNTTNVDYEIILADDRSTDLTQTLSDRVKGVKLVRAEANQGFVNNCRDGASHARGEFILFLNNDTAFTEGWLSKLVAALDEDPGAGIVGPMLLFGNGRLQEAGGITWDDASCWNYGRMDDAKDPEYNYRKETDYVSGACLLIRSALWKQLDGFDQRYAPAYYEDTDLCFAVRSAGYKVLYQPTARIYHFEGISHGTDLSGGVKQHQLVNQDKFLKKWGAILQAESFPNAEQVFFARDRSRGRRTVLVIDHYVPSFDKDAGSKSTWLYLQLMVAMGYNVKFMGANFFPHQPYTLALQSIGIEVLTGEKMARNHPKWLREHAACIDAVYVHRPHIAEQFSKALSDMNPRPKLIYFGHDLHFLRVQRECDITGDESLRALSEKWKHRELAVFKGFDKIYYPSQVEVDVLSEVAPEVDASTIPLYILDEQQTGTYCWKDRRDILFVAGFNHPPNVDGLCWFVDEVMPLVVQECPDIRLHVVGSNAPAAVTDTASKHVIVHGYLSDEELAQQYAQARMVAVPLRFGAGVKGKVLDALQHGLPIVTTAIGAEGLPDAGFIFNIKETAEDFAQELVEIERGCKERLLKLDHYSEYLDQNFSKNRASEILRRDFGEPNISR